MTFLGDSRSIYYRYQVNTAVKFPFAGARLTFEKLEDLSRYTAVSFTSQCDKYNVMTFHIHSFDAHITKDDDFYSYRFAEKDFTCEATKNQHIIDLKYLNVPVWWLKQNNIPVSDTHYRLDKTRALSFDNDHRGPLGIPLHTHIENLTLHYQDWRYIWLAIGLLTVTWLIFLIYWLKRYSRCLVSTVKMNIAENKPFIAYQQLSLEPHRDREKTELLRFMGLEFTNPEMSLEYTVKNLGLNRTKINNLLKEELGLTFTAYLNKLRLAEASKLISNRENRNISEIAFSVGFNNISYFNRLFKNEFGCTPKKFESISKDR